MKSKSGKYIPYGRQSISSQNIAAVIDVLKSDFITQGPKIKEFEDALCAYTGAKYAVAVSSGTAALHLACLAAGIKQGDEVITSPVTFVASANCVLYCGGRPVFADILKDTVNIDPKQIKRKLSKQTKAIIPVHFAGHPADLEEIRDIAKKHNLLVIEDATHALGAEYKGSKIGSCKYSQMTVFSFHPLKSITTGEGGAVLTNEKDLHQKLLILRQHGVTKDNSQFTINNSQLRGPWHYEMQHLGFNYRITDFQCALGISQLKSLNKFLDRRREIVNSYNAKLAKVLDITLPVEYSDAKSSCHIYCIRLKNSAKRKTVFNKMRKAGVGIQVHYIPVHLQPYYRENLAYREGDYPRAEEYYRGTITLPLYAELKAAEIRRVVKVLKESL